MMDIKSRIKIKPSRIILTDQVLRHLFEDIYKGSVVELQKRTQLPYRLIYNIVHKRIKSISAKEYRIIFGEFPPVQNLKKVDGTYFRKMVELWLFLNDKAVKSDLFRELFKKKNAKRINYRIFSGKTHSVDVEIERRMEEKFFGYGLDRKTIKSWIEELGDFEQKERIPYGQIAPVLQFLEDMAQIHPSSVLNQYVKRYQSGRLKRVSNRVYDRAIFLKEKTEKSLLSSSKAAIEKVKEEVYGKKKGYTLYAEIEEEILFIQKHARISPKRYLGRSTTVYNRGGCKRIRTERALKIKADCGTFISQNPELKVGILPQYHQKKTINPLIILLKIRLADMLFQKEGVKFEKHILAPLYSKDEYKKPTNGFTQFDLAPRTLGIKKNVFDLMVATNCEIFKMVGQYNSRWYLSDLYLKELSEKKYFDLITLKYELMAQKQHHSHEVPPTCMN
jgi:hypothetical protein